MWNFPVTTILAYCRNTYNLLFERFIAKKVCTACSRTNNKIVLLINLNKYLSNGKREMTANVNNNSEKLKKKCDYIYDLYVYIFFFIVN